MDTAEHAYVITVNLPGFLPVGDPEAFSATPDEALDALLDQCDYELGDNYEDEDDEAVTSDRALVAQYRTGEGRADLLAAMDDLKSVGIRLESYANSFGAVVTLARL